MRFGLAAVLFITVASFAGAQPASGVTALIGAATNGSQANALSVGMPSLNRTGRFALFCTNATNILPGSAAGNYQVYRKDLQTGDVVMCSSSTAGVPSAGAIDGQISPGARWVVFRSAPLVAEDTTTDYDLYRKDLSTGETRLITCDASGVVANGPTYAFTFSPNGRYVAFESAASNLVSGNTNGLKDIFLKDMETGLVTRTPISSNGITYETANTPIRITDDGAVMLFHTWQKLSSQDANQKRDIYLYHSTSNKINLAVDTYTVGIEAGVGATPDCRYVALSTKFTFSSTFKDNNGVRDIYVRDLWTGKTWCASKTSDNLSGDLRTGLTASLSDDGRFVAFESYATNMIPNDTNNTADVFVRDLFTGELRCASLGQSNEVANGLCDVPTISGNGAVVAFRTGATNLAPSGPGADFFAHGTGFIMRPATLVTVLDTNFPVGAPVVLRATLRDKATRAVIIYQNIKFYIDDKYVGLASTDTLGQAKFTWKVPEGIVLGAHKIFADYAGDDTNYASSYAELGVSTTPSSITVKVQKKEGAVGATINLSAYVQNLNGESCPSQILDFYVDGAIVGTQTTTYSAWNDGKAIVSYKIPASFAVGSTHEIKVVFAGNAKHKAATGFSTLTVSQ